MEKRIVLFSSRNEDSAFTEAAAKVNQLAIVRANNAQEAVTLLTDASTAAAFIGVDTQRDYKNFEMIVDSKLGLFSDKIRANSIHYLCSEDVQELEYLFQSQIFGNYVSRKYGDPEKSGARYGLVLRSLLRDRAFGLKPLLRDERSKVQIVNFQNTSQKQDGVEAVKNYLIAAKFKTRMATVIANAVDELVMNAMFDAPVDALGKSLYLTTPRNASMAISPDHRVELQVGFDGEYAAVMAVDHYGSLDKNKLFSHISKRYVSEEYRVKTSSAGAGIGLAHIFRTGGSFLFASEKGAKTEVTAFFKRTDNFREFKDQFRFIATQFYF